MQFRIVISGPRPHPNTMPNDIQTHIEQTDPILMSFGPGEEDLCIAESFGNYEAEYAIIRKGVGILHAPFHGCVKMTGEDRLTFLQRMVTQDVESLKPGQGQRAFLLSKTGRIDADLVVLAQEDCCLLMLDSFCADAVVAELDRYLFSEDVALSNVSDQYEPVSLLGPAGVKLLMTLGFDGLEGMEPLESRVLDFQGEPGLIYRQDLTGSLGLHLYIPQAHSLAIYQQLTDAVGGMVPNIDQSEGDNPTGPNRDIPGRAVGWSAFNTARIEAGTPLFNVDFGPDCLPHETGILDQAVSFTKGCYLGQEIVGRMQNLGHPKRVLVGLSFEDDRMPIAGSQVQTDDGITIGGITSSAISPLRGSQAVAFAMMKWGKHRKKTKVRVPAEGKMVPAVVAPTLVFV